MQLRIAPAPATPPALLRRVLRRTWVAFCVAAGLTATEPASAAEPPVCTGRDLLAEMQAKQPARYADLVGRADAIDNAGVRLWRVEGRDGRPASYLLGTMHMTDPRVTDTGGEIGAALAAVETLAVEVANLNKGSNGAIGAGADLPVFKDGRTLKSVVSPEVWARLDKATAARGIPAWAVMGWKPLMVGIGILGVSPCELKRLQAGVEVLDQRLESRAREAGKTVVGLEDAASQYAAIDTIPLAAQVDLLKAILARVDEEDDQLETAIRLYAASRVGLFWAFSEDVMRADLSDPHSLEAFETVLLHRRNDIMFTRAQPLVDRGPTLIAVGAGHLIGPTGLVARFKSAGYTVVPVL